MTILLKLHKQIQSDLRDGRDMTYIAENYFGDFLRYERGFRSYRALTIGQRSWQTQTEVLWGPPGTGKSMYAWESGGPTAFWLSKPNSNRVFWDGYDGQEVVVIDEFYGWLPYGFMCRLLDRYPMRVETKGSSVPFLARRIIITSNVCPTRWYNKGLRALRRRLTGELGTVYQKKTLEGEMEPYEIPPPEVFAVNDPFQE